MKQEDYLDWLNTQQASMLDTVVTWANINSGSFHRQGLQKMAKAIADHVEDLKADLNFIPLPDFQFINEQGQQEALAMGDALHLQKHAKAPLQVLLCGHMDTVFAKNHSFQTVVKDGNVLRGPGVTDMKGGLVIMLYALRALERSPLAGKLGWQVLINSDEEIGSISSASLLEKLAKQADFGLDFEPSTTPEGQFAGQRKGSAKFTVLARGRAAHAGRAFAEGRHAIAALAEFITFAHHLNGEREGVTINVGQVRGGEAVNVVPDVALCRIDVRIVKEDDQAWLAESLQAIADTISKQEGITITLHGGFTRAPKLITGKTLRLFNYLKEIGQALGLDINWQATGGCCDGNNLAAAGLANIDTLGARGANIHSSDEYMLIDSLVERARLTAALLFGFASGNYRL